MGKVTIMDHPLIQHKIGIIREIGTGTKEFREIVSEIAMLECYESTRDLVLEDVEIETPMVKTTAKRLAGKKIAIVPILISHFSNAAALTGLSIGGTSIMIAVGVALETVRALEAQMIMRNHKGFLS